jgi:hypothetical protein
MNNLCTGRTDCIPPPAGTVDLAATSVEDCVVQVGWYYARRIKYPDQQDRQQIPQFAGYPGCIWKKAMIGVVGSVALRIGKGHNSCDRAFGSAEHPAGDQSRKKMCCGCCENRQKVLDDVCPCRYSNRGIHTSLPFFLFQKNSSEGWYVFAYGSLKSAA